MKKFILPYIFFQTIFSINNLSAQEHKNDCQIEVKKAVCQTVLSKCRGYYVVFTNTSDKSVDAIDYKASFYNKFGDLLGTRDCSWTSGRIIQPVEPGKDVKDMDTVKDIGDASDVFIKIKRVHYTDNTRCN